MPGAPKPAMPGAPKPALTWHSAAVPATIRRPWRVFDDQLEMSLSRGGAGDSDDEDRRLLFEEIQEHGPLAVFLELSEGEQRSFAEVSLMELAAFVCWRDEQEPREDSGWKLEDDWDMLEGGVKAEWVPEDPRLVLASDPTGRWLALLADGPPKCTHTLQGPSSATASVEGTSRAGEAREGAREDVDASETEDESGDERKEEEGTEAEAAVTEAADEEVGEAEDAEEAVADGHSTEDEAVHEAVPEAVDVTGEAEEQVEEAAAEGDQEDEDATVQEAAAEAVPEPVDEARDEAHSQCEEEAPGLAEDGSHDFSQSQSSAEQTAAAQLARLLTQPAQAPAAALVEETAPPPPQPQRRRRGKAPLSDPIQLAIAAGLDEESARAALQKRKRARPAQEQKAPKAKRGRAEQNGAGRNQKQKWCCVVCGGQRGSLIRCDGCDKAFHMSCHEPVVTNPGSADENWYCAHCTEGLAQKRALRLRPGDFAWARSRNNKDTSLWPCVVLRLDFTKPDDPRPYGIHVFEGCKRPREDWVGEEQVLAWQDGPAVPKRDTRRQAALKQAKAAGAGEEALGCKRARHDPVTPRKAKKVGSPGSGSTASTNVPATTPRSRTSSKSQLNPHIQKEAKAIEALLQEVHQRQSRLQELLSSPRSGL